MNCLGGCAFSVQLALLFLLRYLVNSKLANGSIALCGNAGGARLDTNIYLFILRGINILGINTIFITPEYRVALWNKLATDWNVVDALVSQKVKLVDMAETVVAIKNGNHLGRTIIEVKS